MSSIADVMAGTQLSSTDVACTVPGTWTQLLPSDPRRIAVYFTPAASWTTFAILPSGGGAPPNNPVSAGNAAPTKLSWQWALDGPVVTQQFWASSSKFAPGGIMSITELWQIREPAGDDSQHTGDSGAAQLSPAFVSELLDRASQGV